MTLRRNKPGRRQALKATIDLTNLWAVSVCNNNKYNGHCTRKSQVLVRFGFGGIIWKGRTEWKVLNYKNTKYAKLLT